MLVFCLSYICLMLHSAQDTSLAVLLTLRRFLAAGTLNHIFRFRFAYPTVNLFIFNTCCSIQHTVYVMQGIFDAHLPFHALPCSIPIAMSTQVYSC